MISETVHYFDYNATHPPFTDILEEANKEYINEYFNPSGPTRFSLRRQSRLEEIRKYFGEITDTKVKNLIFTATGTESNYTLISGLTQNWKSQKKLSYLLLNMLQ